MIAGRNLRRRRRQGNVAFSGQALAPVIDVDGQILADFDTAPIGGISGSRLDDERLEPTPTPRPRLPEWLRMRLPTTDGFAHTRALLDELKLHTVCQSAKCPNHWECWSKGTATL